MAREIISDQAYIRINTDDKYADEFRALGGLFDAEHQFWVMPWIVPNEKAQNLIMKISIDARSNYKYTLEEEEQYQLAQVALQIKDSQQTIRNIQDRLETLLKEEQEILNRIEKLK